MKIENYREQPKDSKVIAIFDVYLENHGITIHEFKAIRRKDGKGFFLAPPQFSKQKEDGTKAFSPYVSFSEGKRQAFFDKLVEMVKEIIR